VSAGRLTDVQRALLRDHVGGEVVHDLGAGACTFSDLIANLGALKVYAIDKGVWARPESPKVEVIETYFATYTGPDPEVVFLSWPDNHPLPGLIQLLSKSKKVIYLGKNTDGTMCGWPGLFRHLLTRRILAHAPAEKNSLTVYGAVGDPRTPDTGEEVAMIHGSGEIMSYRTAETLAACKHVCRE
jgi:hypothetical protein